jgi:hypothetical protein
MGQPILPQVKLFGELGLLPVKFLYSEEENLPSRHRDTEKNKFKTLHLCVSSGSTPFGFCLIKVR